ncbi:MAG TPA: zinc ribbon domain-containing protein [Verrucomicrobiae bacterium]|nr:zinc ribbon domain-containing protein [Verrucomicrobiae bacterium]
MMLLTQSFYPADDPNMAVGFIGLIVLMIAGVWAFMRWVLSGPERPDPWGEEVSAEISGGDATPICHRCFTPHKPFAHFCPNCGTPVGPYTNLMPFPYVFSVGHVLRLGTDGAFRRSLLTVAGFILIAIAEYALFAPVYWFMFFRKQFLLHQSAPPAGTETTSSDLKDE